MAFGDPFAANVERKMTKGELIQAIRADISGELDAIYGYDAHVQATDDPVAIAVLSDIRDEEKTHVIELMTLLRYLDPDEAKHFASGQAEVAEMFEKLGIKTEETAETAEAEGDDAPAESKLTIGSMKA